MSKWIAFTGSLLLSVLALATEDSRPATAEEKAEVIKIITSDSLLKGTLTEAQKKGACNSNIISATQNGLGGTQFEAQILCAAKGETAVQDRTFLAINVKGRAYKNFLADSTITIQKGVK